MTDTPAPQNPLHLKIHAWHLKLFTKQLFLSPPSRWCFQFVCLFFCWQSTIHNVILFFSVTFFQQWPHLFIILSFIDQSLRSEKKSHFFLQVCLFQWQFLQFKSFNVQFCYCCMCFLSIFPLLPYIGGPSHCLSAGYTWPGSLRAPATIRQQRLFEWGCWLTWPSACIVFMCVFLV